jgi:DNA-binding response OmpR family regulator
MTTQPQGREVVVIDDDEAVCDALATLVSTHGYPSITFTLGRDALRYMRDGASPRLILVDARMPDLDGWQFLAELGRMGTTYPFSAFLMSADTVLDERRARDLGARGILHKPFDLDQLSTVIRLHCADATESVRASVQR